MQSKIRNNRRVAGKGSSISETPKYEKKYVFAPPRFLAAQMQNGNPTSQNESLLPLPVSEMQHNPQ